ncbi:hypothetical protein HGRIS_007903 [Hohenbuehelia grisea]|uniref:Uncharacterized protein n=1 Tax=Hohenbuehelia grisea TaxID=104357 RepID=A0ABR3J6B4_9AGAR
MPRLARSVLIVLHAASFIGLFGSPASIFCAMASPVSSRSRYSEDDLTLTRPDSRMHSVAPPESPVSSLDTPSHASPVQPQLLRAMQSSSYEDLLGLFIGQVHSAQRNSAVLNNLAGTRVASANAGNGGDNGDFDRQCSDTLRSYNANILNLKAIFPQLTADKGLANYDRDNDVETMMKIFVNFNKDTLSSVTVLSSYLPGGSILGPLVYELKCLLDDILNIIENAADGVITSFSPSLKAVSLKAATASCAFGINIPNLLCL